MELCKHGRAQDLFGDLDGTKDPGEVRSQQEWEGVARSRMSGSSNIRLRVWTLAFCTRTDVWSRNVTGIKVGVSRN